MSGTYATRALIWKEYRLHRGLWLAVITFALLVCVLIGILEAFNRQPDTGLYISYYFFAALSMPAVFALGAGSILFAVEHDNETAEFHRALPVSVRRVFGLKLFSVVLGVLSLWPFVWLLAFAFARPDSVGRRPLLRFQSRTRCQF